MSPTTYPDPPALTVAPETLVACKSLKLILDFLICIGPTLLAPITKVPKRVKLHREACTTPSSHTVSVESQVVLPESQLVSPALLTNV